MFCYFFIHDHITKSKRIRVDFAFRMRRRNLITIYLFFFKGKIYVILGPISIFNVQWVVFLSMISEKGCVRKRISSVLTRNVSGSMWNKQPMICQLSEQLN